jgi:hypothetical protein
MPAQKADVILADIILAVHTMGDCLHDFHTEHNLPDEAFEFAKKTALLAFVDGCNGTDPKERYTHDGN